VQSVTGDLAAQWHISDRGLLKVGLAADLVLFDMDRLHNGEQVFLNDVPGNASRYRRGASGFEAVFVNGKQVLAQDVYTEATHEDAAGCGLII